MWRDYNCWVYRDGLIRIGLAFCLRVLNGSRIENNTTPVLSLSLISSSTESTRFRITVWVVER